MITGRTFQRAAVPFVALIVLAFAGTWPAWAGQVVIENARYEAVVEPFPDNPNQMLVQVSGSTYYAGDFTHNNRLWFIGCRVNTSHHGDIFFLENPEFFDDDQEILHGPNQRLACSTVALFDRCGQDGQSVEYLGWVAAAIYRSELLLRDVKTSMLLTGFSTCEQLFSLRGMVSGLVQGDFLLLEATVRLSDGQPHPVDRLTITSNGAFGFFQQIPDGATYDVQVTSTSRPDLECSVSHGSGQVSGAIGDIQVRCNSGATFAVAGIAQGIASGESVVLELRLTELGVGSFTEVLEVSEDGPFSFESQGPEGWAYAVDVLTHPLGQTCSVAHPSGTLSGELGTDVGVICEESNEGEGESTLDGFFLDVPNPGMGGFLCDFWLPSAYCHDSLDTPWPGAGPGPTDLNCPTLTTTCVTSIETITVTHEDGTTTVELTERIDCTAPGCTVGAATVSPGVKLAGPRTAFVSPSPGETVSGLAEVRVRASDTDGVGSLAVFLDREVVNLENATVTGPPHERTFTGYLPTHLFRDGYHVLHVAVIDLVPEFPVATGYERAFRIDNSGAAGCAGSSTPTTTWAAPIPGSVVSGTVTLAATVQDDGAVTAVEFFVDGVSIGRGSTPDSHNGSLLDWDTLGLQGSHSVRARAFDDCGQIGSTGEVTLEVDNGLQVVQSATGDRYPDGSTFSFPERSVVDLPISELFDVCNDSLQSVAILTPDTLVSGSAFHQIGNPPADALAPGECSSFRVRFHTAHPNTYFGSIGLQTTVGTPYEIFLEAKALAGTRPEIRVEQVATGTTIPDGGIFPFPDTRLNELPISRLFGLCNDGGSVLTIDNPASLVSGAAFSQIGPLPAASLLPGDCTTVRVRFQTGTEGAHAGLLTVENDDPDESSYQIGLAGFALAGSAPDLTVRAIATGTEIPADGDFAFAATALAELPISVVFEACNTGNADLALDVGGTSVIGMGFHLLSVPAPQVSPGLCTPFRVRFHTAAIGLYQGTVSIRSNDPDSDVYSFALSGDALAGPPPEIRVTLAAGGITLQSGSMLAFPDTHVVDLPISRLFRICNDGAGNLTLGQPGSAVSGSGFLQLSSPAPVISSGGCSDLRVRFHVSNPGTYGGTISLSNNDPNETPYVIGLAGTALPDEPPEIRFIQAASGQEVGDGDSFAFPDTPAGQPLSRLFEICNDGAGDLLLDHPGSLVDGAGFSQLSVPVATLSAGECSPVRVRFHQASPGAYTGTITIRSNDVDEDPYRVTLDANAVP